MLSPPSRRTERWTFIIFVLVFFGLMTAEVARDFEPKKLSVLFVMLAWFPLIALHEFGHAIVARCFGHHVHQLVVGFGRPLWTFSLAGIWVEIRALPLEGFVRHSGPSRGYRSALIAFAGPGVELLLAALIYLIVGASLFEATDSVLIILCQSVCIAAVMSAVLNLIPHEVRDQPSSTETTANDGLAILRSLTGRR